MENWAQGRGKNCEGPPTGKQNNHARKEEMRNKRKTGKTKERTPERKKDMMKRKKRQAAGKKGRTRMAGATETTQRE